MLRLFAFSALVAFVSAQSQADNAQCTAALTAVALNEEAASCLNTATLADILTGNTTTTIVPSIEKWLTGLCSVPACSNETLDAAFRNITAGCATELASTGITGQEDTVVSLLQVFYPTARKIVCLQDGGESCVVKTLEDVETAAGISLSTDNIVAAYLGSGIISNFTENITSDIYCSDCFKAAYNILAEDVPQFNDESNKAGLNAQCGANFTDGSVPAGISNIANSGTETSGPNADDAQASDSSSGSDDETGAAVSVGFSQTISMALTAAAVGAFSVLL